MDRALCRNERSAQPTGVLERSAQTLARARPAQIACKRALERRSRQRHERALLELGFFDGHAAHHAPA